MTLAAAAAEVDYKPWQIWYWRRADTEFDEAMTKALEDADALRVKNVEDNMYTRLMSDGASPTEVAFFLRNRAPARWKDRRHAEVTGADGAPLFPVELIRAAVAEADEAEDE